MKGVFGTSVAIVFLLFIFMSVFYKDYCGFKVAFLEVKSRAFVVIAYFV